MKQLRFNNTNKSDYTIPSGVEIQGNLLTLSAEGLAAGDWLTTVTTNKASDIFNNKQVTGINIDCNIPVDTDIRFLVSFDGRQTWEVFKPSGATIPSRGQYDLTLPMTSNASNGLVVTSSSAYGSDYLPFKAFTNTQKDLYDTWITQNAVTTGWIEILLDKPRQITSYSFTTRLEAKATPNNPKDWTLLGSNDGEVYDILDTVVEQPGWGSNEKRYFNLDPTKVNTYLRYKVDVSAAFPGASYVQIGEIEFIEDNCPNWEVVSLDDIGAVGMSAQELMGITASEWSQKFGNVQLNIAMSLISIGVNSPSVKEVQINTGLHGAHPQSKAFGNKVVKGSVQGNVAPSVSIAKKYYGADGETKVHKGFHYTTQSACIRSKQTSGFYHPTIYLNMDNAGYQPVNKTHFGIRYGVGWEEKPPFKPRVLPNEWHPAIYNGQKDNSQQVQE